MAQNKRIESWDFLKAIAIILVIYGHLMQYLWPDGIGIYNPLYSFIYSFHMPLFMTLAGLVAMRGGMKLHRLQDIAKRNLSVF